MHHTSTKDRHFLLVVLCSTLVASLALELQRNNPSVSETDLSAAGSVAVKNYKVQSVAPRSSAPISSRRYGYPYLIAPTLTPNINARSDEDENKAIKPEIKPLGSKVAASEESLKKSNKKYKVPYTYGASRRLGYDEEDGSSVEKRLGNYRVPKYRNYDELESAFRPRRIDIGGPYSTYEYSPKSSRRPPVSPRDPYLSPSEEPSDSFYPAVPKMKSYASSYGQRSRDIPSYGTGRYEDSHPYYDSHSPDSYSKSYDGPSKYPSSGGAHYEDYQEDYAIESNKPITGDIRKRLLDYAGASDLYEGEPDYLQEIALNKHKYGHTANDYYAYGGPAYKDSYRDFPYVESKIRVLKKPRL